MTDSEYSTWDEFLPGEYKEKQDQVLDKARRIRSSPERFTDVLVWLQIGVSKKFPLNGKSPHPVLNQNTIEGVADTLQHFKFENNGKVLIDDDPYPYKDLDHASLVRRLKRLIDAGLIVEHAEIRVTPAELVEHLGNAIDEEDLDGQRVEVVEDPYQVGRYHISESALGMAIHYGVDCYDELRRMILTGIIEEIPRDPYEKLEVEGRYRTNWEMGEKFFNDMNHGLVPTDYDLLGDPTKTAAMAAAITEKNYQYVWSQIDRKDEFVRTALSKLNYSKKIMDMSIKDINPTRKGGMRAAPAIRDAIAEHWEEYTSGIESARIYVEEMILRWGWINLRSTLDKQTGLAETASTFGEHNQFPKLTKWVSELANDAWAQIKARIVPLHDGWDNLVVTNQVEREVYDEAIHNAAPNYREDLSTLVDRFNAAATSFQKISESIEEEDIQQFWASFDMDIRLLAGGISLSETFPYDIIPGEDTLYADWDQHDRKALGLG